MTLSSTKEDLYFLRNRWIFNTQAIVEEVPVDSSSTISTSRIQQRFSMEQIIWTVGASVCLAVLSTYSLGTNKTPETLLASIESTENQESLDQYNRATSHVIDATAARLCYALWYDFEEWNEKPYNASHAIWGWQIELEVDWSTFSDLDIVPWNTIINHFSWVDISTLIQELNNNIVWVRHAVWHTMNEWWCEWRG